MHLGLPPVPLPDLLRCTPKLLLDRFRLRFPDNKNISTPFQCNFETEIILHPALRNTFSPFVLEMRTRPLHVYRSGRLFRVLKAGPRAAAVRGQVSRKGSLYKNAY